MSKTFEEIYQDEKIKIPFSYNGAKRVQRFKTTKSIDFELDESSIDLIKANYPLKCTFPTLKKVAENLIILNREKHRKTDISRLDLMQLPTYHGYKNESFYYSAE